MGKPVAKRRISGASLHHHLTWNIGSDSEDLDIKARRPPENSEFQVGLRCTLGDLESTSDDITGSNASRPIVGSLNSKSTKPKSPGTTSQHPNAGFCLLPHPPSPSLPQSRSPSFPFIAPLHLQDKETYEQWVERERAEAVVKRRSINEMESASPSKWRIYPMPHVSKTGSPSVYRQHPNIERQPKVVRSGYLSKPLDQTELIVGLSNTTVADSEPILSCKFPPRTQPGSMWPASRDEGIVEGGNEGSLEDDRWRGGCGNEGCIQWPDTMFDKSYPLRQQSSVAATLTIHSEIEETLSEVLSRLKDAEKALGSRDCSTDLITEHIKCVNREAVLNDHRPGATNPPRKFQDDSLEFIFTLDGQAHINAEIEELRTEALSHPTVRDVCFQQQTTSPTSVPQMYNGPNTARYSIFQYVPFRIPVPKPVIGRCSSIEALGNLTAVPVDGIGKITIEAGTPESVPKRGRRFRNPVIRVVDWFHERFLSLNQSVATAGEQRWDFPTQQFVPREGFLSHHS